MARRRLKTPVEFHSIHFLANLIAFSLVIFSRSIRALSSASARGLASSAGGRNKAAARDFRASFIYPKVLLERFRAKHQINKRQNHTRQRGQKQPFAKQMAILGPGSIGVHHRLAFSFTNLM